MPNQAVLFDLDGVLVTTEHLKAQAHVSTVERLGGKASIALYDQVMGQPHEEVRRAFLNAAGLQHADMDTYTRTFRQLYKELLENQLGTTPGVPDLLRQLAARHFRLAVVSSSSAETLNLILDRTTLSRYFDVRVAADDVKNKKPAPEAYLLALNRLSVAPSSVVVIEDSESGVKAAVGAGLPVLALRHSFNHSHDFSLAKQVLDSLTDTHAITQIIEALLVPSAEERHG